MLLAIDIGNTNLTCVVFKKNKIIKSFRLETKKLNKNNIKKSFLNALNDVNVSIKDIQNSIIASVVPSLDNLVYEFCKKSFIGKSILLNILTLTKIMPSKYKENNNLGMDRIINTIAAFNKYKGSSIVVDFGTATTFDIVSKKGEFLGGIISFGLKTAMDSLFFKTEKLPTIDLNKKIKKIKTIGSTTKECLLSGTILAYAKMTDGIISEIKKEIKITGRVIATGGLSKLISPFCKEIEVVDENLTMKGLNIIFWHKNCYDET